MVRYSRVWHPTLIFPNLPQIRQLRSSLTPTPFHHHSDLHMHCVHQYFHFFVFFSFVSIHLNNIRCTSPMTRYFPEPQQNSDFWWPRQFPEFPAQWKLCGELLCSCNGATVVHVSYHQKQTAMFCYHSIHSFCHAMLWYGIVEFNVPLDTL